MAINYQNKAKAAGARFAAENAMPKGTQAQHWTKVLLAKKAGLSPRAMNANMSALQSKNNLPATTMLVGEKSGAGTRYVVKGARSPYLKKGTANYGNEHTFADRFLIKRAMARITGGNAKVNPGKAAIAAGGQARWEMTGDPGTVSKGTVPVINIGKGQKFIPKLAGKPGGGKVVRSLGTRSSGNTFKQVGGAAPRTLGQRPVGLLGKVAGRSTNPAPGAATKSGVGRAVSPAMSFKRGPQGGTR